MATTTIKLPAIPYEDAFKFKHYYIAQDKKDKNTYHLYLFEYEPGTLFLSGTGFICANQKYGYIISIKRYKYNIIKDAWISPSTTTTSHKYIDLVDSLVYNNFTMYIEGACYKKNPMPDDQLIEPVIPQFPAIPYCDLAQYKHYLIVQSKAHFDTYSLHLFTYEPVCFKAKDDGRLVAYQQYGNAISFLTYTFRFRDGRWVGPSTNNTLMTYDDLVDTFTYSNFEIKVNDKYFKQNPMPNDNIIPIPPFAFPPVPKIAKEEDNYHHYVLIQDAIRLEKYSLYLLKDKPVDYMLNSNKSGIHFKNEDGKIISIKCGHFTIGKDDWGNTLGNASSIPIPAFNAAGLYNNFKIEVFDSEASAKSLSRSIEETCICKADIRIYPNDGTGISTATTGWVECTNGWHYYKDGYMHRGTEGWLKIQGKTYFLEGEKNWARVENEFRTIRASTYYFGEGGVMLTGSGHKIGNSYYTFDVYGRLVYRTPIPQELDENLSSLNEFISFVEQLEDAYMDYEVPEFSPQARNPIKDILNFLSYYNYTSKFNWSLILDPPSVSYFLTHLRKKNSALIDELLPYISGDNPKLFSDGKDGVLDIAHLAVTTTSYLYGVIISVSWTGWAGDLISAMQNVATHQDDEKYKDNDPQLAADAFIGTKPYHFNYADICTDADAIKLAEMLKKADKDDPHGLSKILREYYENYTHDRMQYYLDDMGGINAQVADIYTYLEGYMSRIPEQIVTIFLNGKIISKKIQEACWRAFAKYICASITKQ